MHSKTSQIGSWFSMFVVMLMAVFGGQKAQAQWAYNQTDLGRMATAANAYQGNAVYFEFEAQGFGTQHGSAFMLNPWVGVAAAHEFQQNGFTFSNFRVGDGSNYITDRGQVYNIAQWETHPTWTGNFNWTTGLDLAWFIVDHPVLTAQTISIGSAVAGETLTAVGTGIPGVAGQGLMSPDGQRRAFGTVVDFFGSPGITSSSYINSIFAPPEIRYVDLGGSATNGLSGSGLLNSSNQLISLLVGGSTVGGFGSSTHSVILDGQEGWIPTVPTPGTAVLLGLGGLWTARRRR